MKQNVTKIYTENEAREIASKFSSRIEFKKGDNCAYRAALKKYPHVLDEIFGRRNKRSVNQSNFTPMETIITVSFEMTKLKEVLRGYKSRVDLIVSNPSLHWLLTGNEYYYDIMDEVYGPWKQATKEDTLITLDAIRSDIETGCIKLSDYRVTVIDMAESGFIPERYLECLAFTNGTIEDIRDTIEFVVDDLRDVPDDDYIVDEFYKIRYSDPQ